MTGRPSHVKEYEYFCVHPTASHWSLMRRKASGESSGTSRRPSGSSTVTRPRSVSMISRMACPLSHQVNDARLRPQPLQLGGYFRDVIWVRHDDVRAPDLTGGLRRDDRV